MSYFESKKLRETRGEVFAKQTAIAQTVKLENRSFTAEELAEFDGLDNEVRSLDDKIASAERIEAIQERSHKAPQNTKFTQPSGLLSNRTVNQALKGASLTALGKNAYVTDEMRGAMQRCNLGPTGCRLEKRTYDGMSIGTPADGGYFTQETLLEGIFKAVKAFVGLRSVATVRQTADGNTMPFIVENNTSVVAAKRSEGAAMAFANNAISRKTLSAIVYASAVKVSVEMLRDSLFDVTGYVTQALGERWARGTSPDYVSGTGGPNGLLTRTTAGCTTDTYVAVTYDDLLDMEHSIDPAVRNSGKCKWVVSDSFMRVIKGLLDDNNRPLYQPSLIVGQPSTILGYEYVIDASYPAMGAASRKVATFGDHSHFVIRDVASADFVIFNELYRATEGAIGYGYEMATDSDLIVASGFAPVKHMALGTSAS